jgi:signal transduction histidine kinase
VHPVLRLFRTASFGFAALYVLLFAISAGILGGAVFVIARSSLQQQLAAEVGSDSAFLQAEYHRAGLVRLQALIQARGQEPYAPDYLLQSADGRNLAGEIPAQPRLRPGWTTLQTTEESIDGDGFERVRALVVSLGGGLLLAVGDDLSRISELEEAIATAFAWTVGLAVVLGIGGGVLLSRAYLARVDAIARTAEAIIAGDLARRIPVRGSGDDLDRLAATLNHMLDRISALMESLRQVSSDVAHDLRTPLSRLYQKLDDARDNARSIPEYRRAVEGAVQHAEALMDTFSALLRITQIEGASPRSAFRDVDLTAVVDAVVDAYRPDAEDAGHVMVAEAEAGVVVHGDQELLTQALANLVENVLRHTPSGTMTRLSLGHRDSVGFCLTVEDNGPGVPAEDLPRLTQRFYRAERSRTTQGNGLGLSLVAAVAELHGCKLVMERLSPGLRVVLQFPETRLVTSARTLG